MSLSYRISPFLSPYFSDRFSTVIDFNFEFDVKLCYWDSNWVANWTKKIANDILHADWLRVLPIRNQRSFINDLPSSSCPLHVSKLIKHSIISMENRARRNKYAKVSSVWWCIRKSGIGLDVFVDMLQSARSAYARSERDYFATQASKYWLLFESVIRRLCTLGFSPAVKLLPSCPRYVWVSDFPDSFVDFRPRPVA